MPPLTMASWHLPPHCRGAVSLGVRVATASKDAPSGVYGGSIQNSVHALVSLLASLRHENGSVAVEGFYDNVRRPTVGEMKEIAR